MATWRHFARREFPRVVLELGLPAATGRPDLDRCPLHGDVVGSVTHLCKTCFDIAWEEVGRRYREQGRPVKNDNTDPKEVTMTSTELAEREPEIIDAEIATPTPAPLTLFGSNDPDVVVAQAAKVARALEKVIRAQGLYVSIRGKDYVKVDGWTLLGTMLGVFPFLVWSHKLEDGWEARVEARTLDGRVVGAAESMCTRGESRWRSADEYAVRSMAETRTTGKALRQPLAFVMHLAGFEETPADEIPQDEPPAAAKPAESPGPIPSELRPTDEQKARIRELFAQLAEADPETDWAERARQIAGCPSDHLTETIMGNVIARLAAQLEQLTPSPDAEDAA